MRNMTFKPEVYEDIQSAYHWYESQRTGLGEDFLLTLEESFAKISRTPKHYPMVYKSVQRKLIRRFPYGIFFTLRENEIVVIAVLHTKSNPVKWNERI